MKSSELKVDQKLKKRIKEGYTAISKAMAEGRNTTEGGKQVVRLERKLIEDTLGVSLTKEELEYLKALSAIKSVFPGARVVEVKSARKRGLNKFYDLH